MRGLSRVILKKKIVIAGSTLSLITDNNYLVVNEQYNNKAIIFTNDEIDNHVNLTIETNADFNETFSIIIHFAIKNNLGEIIQKNVVMDKQSKTIICYPQQKNNSFELIQIIVSEVLDNSSLTPFDIHINDIEIRIDRVL